MESVILPFGEKMKNVTIPSSQLFGRLYAKILRSYPQEWKQRKLCFLLHNVYTLGLFLKNNVLFAFVKKKKRFENK